MKTTPFAKTIQNQQKNNISMSQVGPDDHSRRPRSPQGAPRTPPGHPQKTVCVFGASRALPEEPPGPPRDPPRDPRDSPETPGTLPRTPRDLPETSKDPPREPPRARGPPQNPPEKPRDTPSPLKQTRECAKRLNLPNMEREARLMMKRYETQRSRI